MSLPIWARIVLSRSLLLGMIKCVSNDMSSAISVPKANTERMILSVDRPAAFITINSLSELRRLMTKTAAAKLAIGRMDAIIGGKVSKVSSSKSHVD